MKTPYRLIWNAKAKEVNYRVPSWTLYPFPIAQWQVETRFREGMVFHQSLTKDSFHIGVVEVMDLYSYTIHCQKGRAYIIFVLGGSALMRNKEGLFIEFMRNGRFGIGVTQDQELFLELPFGRLSILTMSMDYELFKEMSRDYSGVDWTRIPFVPMDRFVKDLLLDLQRSAAQGSLDTKIKYFFNYLLDYYKSNLPVWEQDEMWKVRKYIDEDFQNPELDLNAIAAREGIPETSFRQQFHRAYKVTPHHYLTSRRLQHYLKNYSDVSPALCYLECGYNSESALRYELRKFGIAPQVVSKKV